MLSKKLQDEIIDKTILAVFETARKYKLKIRSIILYGSRARGERSSKSDYDFFVLLDNRTNLLQFSQFASELRLKLYSVGDVKLFSNTVKNFKGIMKNNPFLGSFCYIIASEGIPVYDREKTFRKIQEEINNLPVMKKIEYIKKCISMSEKMGSKKWIEYWNEKLNSLI
jgi:predicted nucleotidyltransferase